MNASQHPIEQTELMAFLDGELPSERAAAVAAHLTQCGECRVAVAESRDLAERLTAWQVEPAPASLTERVTAAATSGEVKPPDTAGSVSPRPRFPRFAFPKWVWAAAGGVCMLLITAAVSMQTMFRSRQAGRTLSGQPMYDWASATSATVAPPASRAAADRAGVLGGLAETENRPQGGGGGGGSEAEPPMAGPMIARTAALTLLTKDFDRTRTMLEMIIRRHRGYSAQLTVGSGAGSAHTLSASFRVPADQLDAAMAEIKQLAHVEQESQGGEEVTAQYVDLQARFSNARRTEQTLLELLQKRTGELSDVLAVEQELSRVREEIERMEAELKSLQNRVSFATLQVELREEYKAQLEIPHSLGGRLRNALVDGFRTAADSLVGVVMFFAGVGPFLLLWALILFLPARYLWRRLRARRAEK